MASFLRTIVREDKGLVKLNRYKKILENNISKLLLLYNRDCFSKTYGYGDREFWAWKTKDFCNATFQGGVHSFAIAIKLGLIVGKEKQVVLNIIDAAIFAVNNIRDENGSVVEAYPKESSFCVTALVAFDILSAINYLKNEISSQKKKDYLYVIAPLIDYITEQNEEHAVISNHLATAVAAICLWNKLVGAKNLRYKELLQIIYDHQSEEGWYKEYEGSDPGYQTLCTYYLYCAYQILKDKELLFSLKQSAKFLSYFVHPDCTLGGLYGSRNTEVFYPAGVLGLSKYSEDFALVASCLEPKNQHILPQYIDYGNFIPLLNSYATAAVIFDDVQDIVENNRKNPFYKSKQSKYFLDAGIYIHSTSKYFAIVNYKKGGTIKLFDKELSCLDVEDGGLFGYLTNGTKVSTQQFDKGISFQDKYITCNLYKVNESYPTSFDFILIRLLSLTVFKSIYLGNLFKKLIVKLLMTGKRKIKNCNVKREFIFKEHKIIVKEAFNLSNKVRNIRHFGKVKAMHMASSGYFLEQDFSQTGGKFLEFKKL